MKKHILILILFVIAGVVGSHAQHRGMSFEKIKTLKVNYISSELNLTPEVAEKFWPIYNEYEKVNRKLRSEKIKNIKQQIDNKGAIATLSDEEAKALSDDFIKITETYVSNKKNTFEKLESILTPQQLLKLHFSELEFNQKVLRKLHHEKNKNRED